MGLDISKFFKAKLKTPFVEPVKVAPKQPGPIARQVGIPQRPATVGAPVSKQVAQAPVKNVFTPTKTIGAPIAWKPSPFTPADNLIKPAQAKLGPIHSNTTNAGALGNMAYKAVPNKVKTVFNFAKGFVEPVVKEIDRKTNIITDIKNTRKFVKDVSTPASPDQSPSSWKKLTNIKGVESYIGQGMIATRKKDGSFQYTDFSGAGAVENIGAKGAKPLKNLLGKIFKSEKVNPFTARNVTEFEQLKKLNPFDVPATKEFSNLSPFGQAKASARGYVDDSTKPFKSPFGITKERGFITSAKNAPQINENIKMKVGGTYNSITNKETLEEAKHLISTNTESAIQLAKSNKSDALSNTVRQQLIVEYQNAGKIEDAIDMAELTAKKATTQGQAVQALAAFGRLTPEGILRYAQKQIDFANETRKLANKIKLEPEVASGLIKQAREIQKMADGRAKEVAVAQLLDKIADQIPATILQKISSLQTMSQLLNPKTAIRNIVGNFGFAGAETAKDVVAVAVDKVLSMATGKRTKAFPSFISQLKGFKKGFGLGLEDALKGINTSNVTTQFDLPQRLIFKFKPLRAAEKLMNIELRATDRAFYTAAFEDSLRQQMKVGKVKDATDEMIETAHLDGLYRTFQDDSAMSKVFSGIKKSLNVGKDFGIGDIVIKYPKTPGNLLSRGLAYTPAGFLNSVYELAKPVLNRQFNQKAFVEAFSRASVGTSGLVGTGAILHRLGIVTGKKPGDKDLAQLERETGLGQYKINVSALKRFALSFDADQAKPREGDKLVSYDWFQPAAIGVSIGANIDENLSKPNATGKIVGIVPTFISSLGEGIDTLAEQPLVQGLTRPFKYSESFGDAGAQVAKGIPASFIPTFLNQIRQLTDNAARETKDPSILKEAVNIGKAKVPGLASSLPQRKTLFGENQETYQNGSNTLLNVFMNPAFTSKIKQSPEAKMVFDIYKNSGETQQTPRVVPFSQSISKEGESSNIKLTGKQQTDMQEFVGKTTKKIFSDLLEDKDFMQIGDEEKAKYMAGLLSDINTVAKMKLLGHRPLKPDKRVKDLYYLYGQ